jgi:hypothetical protein
MRLPTPSACASANVAFRLARCITNAYDYPGCFQYPGDSITLVVNAIVRLELGRHLETLCRPAARRSHNATLDL